MQTVPICFFNIERVILMRRNIKILFGSAVISAALIIYHYFLTSGDTVNLITRIAVQIMPIALIIYTVKAIFNRIRKNQAPHIGDTIKNLLDDKSDWWCIIAFTLVITNIFTNSCFYHLINYHSLGKEQFGGIYSYYVIAKSESGKEYTLPAEVHISSNEEIKTAYYNIGVETEVTKYHPNYIVNRVYFKNGGYLYFEDGLEFRKAQSSAGSYDQNGKYWSITLTNRHTESEFITETEPTNSDHIFLAVCTLLSLAQCVVWAIKLR